MRQNSIIDPPIDLTVACKCMASRTGAIQLHTFHKWQARTISSRTDTYVGRQSMPFGKSPSPGWDSPSVFSPRNPSRRQDPAFKTLPLHRVDGLCFPDSQNVRITENHVYNFTMFRRIVNYLFALGCDHFTVAPQSFGGCVLSSFWWRERVLDNYAAICLRRIEVF